MATQRPSRYLRAHQLTPSPASSLLSDFLSPDRNSERNHQDALAAAAAEHERIRAKAIHTLYVHEQTVKKEQLLEEARQELERRRAADATMHAAKQRLKAEEQRLRSEQAARDEQQRLRDIAAKKILPLSPLPASPRADQREPTAQSAVQTSSSTVARKAPSANAAPPASSQPQPTTPVASGSSGGSKSTLPNRAAFPAIGSTSAPASSATTRMTTSVKTADPMTTRAHEIHKNLKQLRAFMTAQGRQNMALKSKAGDLRRELRKLVGQFSFNKDANRKAVQKTTDVFKEALANDVGSELMDPSPFLFTSRQAIQGAAHNAELPSLFLYLINHFTKAMINQFINECGTNTKFADPIGVCAATVFADPLFHWRGQPIIDILMAKFRVVCPVLFGYRGSEKTDVGRDLVGWKRRGSAWIPESEHLDRQSGLAAGYAAVCLRDFSKSKKTTPYPMTHYWEAMAKIVNTPPSETSITQCIVLRAMIDHFEARFLLFYGSAAVAALRVALVEFPAAVAAAGLQDACVKSLAVHGQFLKQKVGLVLA